MVARARKHARNRTDELVVTLSDGTGRVLHQEVCTYGHHASQKAAMAIARRDPMQAGDMLRVTVPAIGEIQQPRETD